MQTFLNILSILAFAISMYNFIRDILINRTRVDILVQNIFGFGSDTENDEILFIKIINRSMMPMCIGRITIKSDKNTVFLGEYRRLLYDVKTRTNGVVTSHKEWYSDTLPVKIDSYGYYTGLLLRSGTSPFFKENMPYTLTFYTDKGPIRKKAFFTSYSSEELLSQCREPN